MPRSCPRCGEDNHSDEGNCSCCPLPEAVRVDRIIDGTDVGGGDSEDARTRVREVAVMVAMNVLRRALSRAAVEAGRTPMPLSLPGRRPLPTQVARLAVAPMMEWTDRHYRVLARMMTRHTELYTEMIGDAAVVRGPERLTLFNPVLEEPLVLQLGGSSPDQLARAAAICHARGYREFNLNVGCPSDRGQKVCNYGAVLMANPELVGECMRRVGEAVPPSSPVTVKCRLGIGNEERYDDLSTFVQRVYDASGGRVTHFVVHARRAIINQRLTPEQNRNIPPLRYDLVYRLVTDFPHLRFTLNGGVKSLKEATEHLARGVHGVMVGRAAYKTPWAMLGDADRVIFGSDEPTRTRRDILKAYAEYAAKEEARGSKQEGGASAAALLKPLAHLFAGELRGKEFRKALEVERIRGRRVADVIAAAAGQLPDDVLDAPPPRDS